MTPPRLGPVLFALTLLGFAHAAPSPLQEKVRAWRTAHESELIVEYRELLAIPNTSIDRANIRRNADFIAAMMKRRGIDARLLTMPIVNSDNNQHAENENVKVQFLWDGIETYTALMTM